MIWISAIYKFQNKCFHSIYFLKKSFEIYQFDFVHYPKYVVSLLLSQVLFCEDFPENKTHIRFEHMQNTAIKPIEFFCCNEFLTVAVSDQFGFQNLYNF